jgi:S-disulfanyl-L-cysteine oxidoreductase SoxD
MNKVLLSSIAILGLACSTTPPPESPEPLQPAAESPPATGEASPATAPVATFAEQVALGQTLYGQQCASCHGNSGEGGKAPAVVGLDKGALPLDPPPTAKYRKTQFKTVADIATFVVKHMPANAPGSLPEEQYWAILAFDLKANGIELDKKLDGALAATLTVPRK